MKIDWSKQIHDGWRRSLGVFCLTFAVASAAMYYADRKQASISTAVATTPTQVVQPSDPIAQTATPSLKSAQNKESGRIHLLTASQQELESLPGIGPAKATAIIEYREKNGFKSVNELDKVKGIGPATLEKLRPLVEL